MTRNTRILLVVLIIQMILGVSYAILTPLWQGHEPDYYNVARFIVDEHRFPTAADYPNGDAEIRQATQPPLYFLIAAPIVALFDNGQQVPYGVQPTALCPGGEQANSVVSSVVTNQAYDHPYQGTVAAAYFLRFVNVLFGAVAVFFTYRAGQALFPERPVLALIGAAILAFEPATLQFVPEINNDSLLLAVCAALLFMSARILSAGQIRWRDLLILVGLSIAAPLVKLPGWVALAVGFLVLTYRLVFRSRGSRITLLGLGLIVILAIGVGVFNFQQYGSVLGRYSVLDSLFLEFLQKLSIPWVVIAGVIDQTHGNLLAPLAALHPRAAFVNGYNLLLIVCFVSILLGLISVFIKRAGSQLRAYILLMAVVIITVIIVILRNTLTADANNTTDYNQAMIFAPVRYFVPALPALALLVAAGLGSILPRFSRGLLGVLPALSFGIVSVGTGLLLLVSRPADARIDPGTLARLPDVQLGTFQSADDAPEVVGYRLEQRSQEGWLDLTLYLKLEQATTTNFVARAELSDGTARHSLCEFLPAQGVYPTPRWAAGQIVVAEAHIPNCSADFPADTRLTLRWVGYSLQGDSLETTPAVQITQLDQPLATAKNCPADLGVIDDSYQLVKWNSPAAVKTGEVYLPSVNWLVLRASPTPLNRVFQFTHQDTGKTYTCVGSPSQGLIPIPSWKRGSTIYFDQCVMQFPADAPLGQYRVLVGMENQNAHLLPALQPDGEQTSWLQAGQVEVR